MSEAAEGGPNSLLFIILWAIKGKGVLDLKQGDFSYYLRTIDAFISILSRPSPTFQPSALT